MLRQFEDYYKALGVSPAASRQEIKEAFRLLAKKHHPDVGGDEHVFQRLREAHDVLSDPGTRQIYNGYYEDHYRRLQESKTRTPSGKPGKIRKKPDLEKIILIAALALAALIFLNIVSGALTHK